MAGPMVLTGEQEAVVDAALGGGRLCVTAGAGTGKTSTLVAVAEAMGRPGRYLAFNAAIVADSRRRLPTTVAASTAHGVAFRAVGKAFAGRLGSGRMRSEDMAAHLRLGPIEVEVAGRTKVLSAGFLAGVAMRAVVNFSHSADSEPAERHVPYLDGIDLPDAAGRRGWANNRHVRRLLLPTLARVWADVSDPHGVLRYQPDFYLKLFELSRPRLGCEWLAVDEAQDLSPVLWSIVSGQDCQVILVGDRCQAIYGWLGAVDAMGETQGWPQRILSRSFRFGPAVAEVANSLLARLDAPLRLTGAPAIASTVGPVERPDAVIARSNAGVVSELLASLRAGRPAALAGGGNQIRSFCRAALDLQHGRATQYRELACFDTWDEVVDYVTFDPQGDELRLMVDLTRRFGAERILAAVAASAASASASMVVTTAHKAKGREWDRVRLADDFKTPAPGRDLPADELRLLYVACTRARLRLDAPARLLRSPQTRLPASGG